VQWHRSGGKATKAYVDHLQIPRGRKFLQGALKSLRNWGESIYVQKMNLENVTCYLALFSSRKNIESLMIFYDFNCVNSAHLERSGSGLTTGAGAEESLHENTRVTMLMRVTIIRGLPLFREIPWLQQFPGLQGFPCLSSSP